MLVFRFRLGSLVLGHHGVELLFRRGSGRLGIGAAVILLRGRLLVQQLLNQCLEFRNARLEFLGAVPVGERAA